MEKLFDFSLEPRLEGTDKLYFRNDGDVKDTYFNCIPYGKIKKYTDITKISMINNSVFVESKTVNPVNCAIIFCTYKREKFIKRNVSYLAERIKNQSDFSCKIIVVDNAQTLSQSDFDGDVLLIGNINSGGSGGFKRGMEEAAKIGGFTHFVLMDDDVEIDFVSIQKMLNFMRFLKPEYKDLSIAGSMLYLDKPTVQFEAGGHFESDGTQKSFGHFLDLSEPKNLIANDEENDINYGGWWLMCMPFRYIEEENFPLPFFLKYDDVEYALRCKLKIITLNGVGVWHEKFETKYNSSTEYYNIRNYLFLCSLYCDDFDAKKAKEITKRRIREKTKRQQYQMAEAVKTGYEDYLKGFDYLRQLDAEKNHKKICNLNYEMLSYGEIEKRYGLRPESNRFYPPFGRKKLLDPKVWLPKKAVFTDYYYDNPLQYFGAKMAVHCDCERNCGYVTQKIKRKEMIKN